MLGKIADGKSASQGDAAIKILSKAYPRKYAWEESEA